MFSRFPQFRRKRQLASSCPPGRLSSWNNSAPTDRIFVKFCIWVFFRKSVVKIQVSLKSNNNNRYFTWRPIYICDPSLAFLFLEWKIFQKNSCSENQNKICFQRFPPFPENRVFYEIMFRNTLEGGGTPQMTIWRVRIVCWITKATQIHTITLCNTYCLSTATMIARTHLHYLSCCWMSLKYQTM